VAAQESQSLLQLVVKIHRRQGFILEQRQKIANQIGRGFERGWGVGEDQAVTDQAVVHRDVGQDQG
jgi:hypothetical protein